MSGIQKKVISVIACTLCISLFLIFLSAFYLRSNGVETPLQTSISLIGNYVGAITTLAAAYIASLLFNDWRDQHNKQVLAAEAKELHKKLSNLTFVSDMHWSKVTQHMSKQDVLCSLTDLTMALEDIFANMISFHELSGKSSPLMDFITEIADSGDLYLITFIQFEHSSDPQDLFESLTTAVDNYNLQLKEIIGKTNDYLLGFILLDLA